MNSAFPVSKRGTVFVVLFGFIILYGFLVAPVAAETLATPPDLKSAGWKALKLTDGPPAEFAGREDGSIEVVTHAGTSMLYRRVEDVAAGKPILRWRWRVDETTPATDQGKKGADDRPLALHLWFPSTKGHRPGLFRRLGRSIVSAFGTPVPGKAITYIWGGTNPTGATLVNPYFGPDGILIVLRDSHEALGVWQKERIDYAADFEAAFGYEAPAPRFVVISADSDDTQTSSRGSLSNITFEAEPD